jgi:hypothetical protein
MMDELNRQIERLEKRFQDHIHAGQFWINIFLLVAIGYCLIMITDMAMEHGRIPTLKWEYSQKGEEIHHVP